MQWLDAAFGSNKAGLASVHFRLYDAEGSSVVARTSAGVQEIGGGAYGALVSVHVSAVGIEWDTGEASAIYAHEALIMQTALFAVAADVSAVKTDTSAIISDVSAVKTDTTAIFTYASAIKLDTSAIIADVSAIKTDTSTIIANLSVGGLTAVQDVRLTELHQIFGLASGFPLHTTASSRAVASITQTIAGDAAASVVVTRT